MELSMSYLVLAASSQSYLVGMMMIASCSAKRDE